MFLPHKQLFPQGQKNAVNKVRDRLEATTTICWFSESCFLVTIKQAVSFPSLSQSLTTSGGSSKTLVETRKLAFAWHGLHGTVCTSEGVGPGTPSLPASRAGCRCCKTSLVQAGRAGGCAGSFGSWLVRKDGEQSRVFHCQTTWKMFKIQRKKTPNRKPDWKETT